MLIRQPLRAKNTIAYAGTIINQFDAEHSAVSSTLIRPRTVRPRGICKWSNVVSSSVCQRYKPIATGKWQAITTSKGGHIDAKKNLYQTEHDYDAPET